MSGNDKLSIMLWSASVDKLYPVAMLAAGAAAMDVQVNIFLTFSGVEAFRKGALQTNTQITGDYASHGEKFLKLIQEHNVPPWYQTLAQAKEMGDVKISACAMTMDLFGLTKDDLDEMVEDIEGMASFAEEAKGGQILFV
ncbi:MAG: DsrE/DsrF/DrsH-like family protein [Dehalococcoidia bacterium]